MKKLSIILSVLLLVTLLAVPGLAEEDAEDYENPGAFNKFGTKAYGMGGAFTAVADDASTIYWNPAGLTQSNLIGVQASGGGRLKPKEIKAILDMIKEVKDVKDKQGQPKKLLAELEDLNVPDNVTLNLNGMAAANLTKFGAGIIVNDNFNFEGGKQQVDLGPDHTGTVPSGEATNTLLTQGLAGFGTNLIDPPLIGSISIGATGKYLYKRKDKASIEATTSDLGIAIPDPEEDTGFGADVGALATLSDIDILNAKAGVTVRNAFCTLDGDYPSLQRSMTLGTGVTFKFPLVELLSARVAGDVEILEPTGAAKKVKRLGAEGTVGPFSVRGGVYGTDLKNEDKRTITGGVGLNLPFIDFNLAADSDAYVNFSGTFNF